MFSRRDLISSPAHGAIVDGDDLFLTGSFEAEEDNSSVVANPSCRTRSVAVGFDHPTTKVAAIDEKDDEKKSVQFSRGSLKMKKMLSQVRKLPLRLRQKSFLFKSSTNTVAEYEEIFESGFMEEEENYAIGDAETIASLRSSRNNLATGMSMLIRQKAQVMNRPSTAFKGASPSPSDRRGMLLRGKSLVLDDSSIGGMSDITEDASAAYALPMTIQSSFRRTPMFINANTYRINEDEDESESDSDEMNTSGITEEDEEDSSTIEHHAYDFRVLSPLKDGIESNAGNTSRFTSPDGSEETATRSNAYDSMRRRVYSDSDIDSEARFSNLSSLTISSNSKSNEGIRKEERRSLGSSLHKNNNKFIGNTNVEKSSPERNGPTPPRKAVPYSSWPFPRTRTYSDSYVDQTTTTPTRKDHNKVTESPNTIISSSRNKNSNALISDAILTTRSSSRRQSLPLFQGNIKSPESLRSRTYSDSVVNEKSVQEDILWDPRSFSLLDTAESPMASPTKMKTTNDDPKRKPSGATSSVLATLSDTNTYVAERFVAADEEPQKQRQQSQKSQLRTHPSPRTLHAANKIAAALLPAPAKHLPALPSPIARKSAEQYYWGDSNKDVFDDETTNSEEGQELELKDLCSWSSDSYDDIL